MDGKAPHSVGDSREAVPTDPEVTILIPVRDGEDFIADAIESVMRQTFTRWMLLVRDNLSRDGTRSVVRRYLSDPRIRLLEGKSDLTMAGSFNACLDAVATKYYMLLCHDDYLCAPHAIEAAYQAMESDPELPAVYSDLLYVNQDRVRIATRKFGRAGKIRSLDLARSSIVQMRNMFGIPLLVRTSALGPVRYDESLPYVIDLDVSIATAMGRNIYHVSEPLIANRYHGRNSTGRLLKGVTRQMEALARRYEIQLSPADRIRMIMSTWYTGLAKPVFLLYARISNLFSSSSRLRATNVKTVP